MPGRGVLGDHSDQTTEQATLLVGGQTRLLKMNKGTATLRSYQA